MSQRTVSKETADSVELQDGPQFSFYYRQGELVLQDGTRTWPVRSSKQGNEVRFNWSDTQFATIIGDLPLDQQENLPTNSQNSSPPAQGNSGQFGQGLFDSLFR